LGTTLITVSGSIPVTFTCEVLNNMTTDPPLNHQRAFT